MQIVRDVKGRTWGESCKIYWKISKVWREVFEILCTLQCSFCEGSRRKCIL